MDFDVVVIGAGHAGIEAASSAARFGLKVLVVTTNLDRIGYMSCNPAIGGLAKGHMVREIDILGGEMGLAADASCIQFKRLNAGKGPAVRGTRMQCDKDLYSDFMKSRIQRISNIRLLQAEVKALVVGKSGHRAICGGVLLEDGSKILSKAVVITSGTFMNAVMHIGAEQAIGGRVGDKASMGLSDQLKNEFGFEVKRLKTGTPPRLRRDSIDWDRLQPQWGDQNFFPFSFRSAKQTLLPQIACYISRTSAKTHQIIRDNLHLSPMYCGRIEGVGPRYCPSIEDKVVRFADKESHQTFLEPEGLNTDSVYLQGISTSLPKEIQLDFLKTIEGLERVEVIRFGYAVEYDFLQPTQLFKTLEARQLSGLFCAGQVNGTSGYEEAAIQGLLAGINAAHSILDRGEFILGREEAYGGVLIDDLVSKGTQEPYRMLTSRAEHRLVLREDNTFDRLYQKSLALGLLSKEELDRLSSLVNRRAALLDRLRSEVVYPNQVTQDKLLAIGSVPLRKALTFEELLRRPEISFSHLSEFQFETAGDPFVDESVEIEVKYKGYVERQNELLNQLRRWENIRIPPEMNFNSIRGLSSEEVEKLSRIRPRNLREAQQISGISPSGTQLLMIALKKTAGKLCN
jgi:tRNA uridine 5-carboxymethylaminomethyl modification enzyme